MQLRSRHWLLAGLIVAGSSASVSPARALDWGIDEQSAGYIFHYFADADDVHVVSSYGAYDLALENGAALAVRVNHEAVIVPAVDAPQGSDEAVDAITTASRPIRDADDAFEDYVKNRDEFRATMAKSGASFGYYMSKETDYFAQQLTAGYNRDFRDQNFNVSVGAAYGWDAIVPLQDVRGRSVASHRNTAHLNAVVTQVLTSTTVLRVGAEWNEVNGLQHNPYRNVYVAGTNVFEQHPGARSRRDVFAKLSQYFSNRSSVQLDYIFYDDDWGLRAHTLGGPAQPVRHRAYRRSLPLPLLPADGGELLPSRIRRTRRRGWIPDRGLSDGGLHRSPVRNSPGMGSGQSLPRVRHPGPAARQPELRAVFQQQQLLRQHLRERNLRRLLMGWKEGAHHV
jgi:hypothetical protein